MVRDGAGRQGRGNRGLVLAVLSAATFGTSGSLATSLLRAGWTPGAAVALRVAIAAAVLSPAALWQLRGRWGLLRRNAGGVAVYGLAAVAGCQLCYFHAVEHLSVAVGLLLEYSGTLLVVAWLWARHGDRPRRLTATGAVAAIAGLVLVLGVLGDHHVDGVGLLWGLGAAVGLAVYYVLSADGEDALPPLVAAWAGLAVGAALLLLAGGAGLLPWRAPEVAVVLGGARVSWLLPLLGVSLVAAALAYVLGILAARSLGATVSSFVGLAEVLFAVLFAWVLLGQALRPLQLAGAALVVGGIGLVRLDGLRAAGTQEVASPLPEAVPLP